MTSGASSNRRLAMAEATRSCSRRRSDSLTCSSSAARMLAALAPGSIAPSSARPFAHSLPIAMHVSESVDGSLARPGGSVCKRGRGRQWQLFPAPAQGLVDGDQAGRSLSAALRQTILVLELRALGIEHLQKIDQPTLKAQSCQLCGGMAGLSRALEMVKALAGARMGDECALGFFQRTQYNLLVACQCGLIARARACNPGANAAQVERRPGDARRNQVRIGPGFSERARLSRDVSDAAGKADLGEQIANRHADARRLCGEITLRNPDVRPAAQQTRRVTDRGDTRKGREVFRWSQHPSQGGRLATGEDAEANDCPIGGRVERADGRERGAELRLGARGIQFGAAAGIQPDGGELQSLLLVIDVAPGDRKLSLQATQFKVGAGDFRRHNDLRVAQSGLGALHLGMAGFNAASHTAKQIEFPRSIEARVVLALIAPERGGTLFLREALLRVSAARGDGRCQI